MRPVGGASGHATTKSKSTRWVVARGVLGRWASSVGPSRAPRVRGIMYDPPHQGIVMDGWPTMVVGVKRCPSVDGGSRGATPPFRPTVNDGTSRSAFRHSRGCGGGRLTHKRGCVSCFAETTLGRGEDPGLLAVKPSTPNPESKRPMATTIGSILSHHGTADFRA